jgi:hypothetical protein
VKKRSTSGLLVRPTQRRDAWLFVLALEGERTGAEYKYFRALEDGALDGSRVRLHPLPTDPAVHDSAPEKVLARLRGFLEKYEPRTDRDQYWLVLDVDTWPVEALGVVAQEAARAGYRLAISNPCFEVWLVLHETEDLGFLAGFGPPKRSGATKRRLGELCPQGITEVLAAKCWTARARAHALDTRRDERWPNDTGTHVYRLIDAFADAGALALPERRD